MSERPRGPLTLLSASRRFRRCVAVVLALPILYVASFGPACWWMSGSARPSWYRGRKVRIVPWAYAPIAWAAMRGPYRLRLAIRWYGTRGGETVFWGPENPNDWDGGFDGANRGIVFTYP